MIESSDTTSHVPSRLESPQAYKSVAYPGQGLPARLPGESKGQALDSAAGRARTLDMVLSSAVRPNRENSGRQLYVQFQNSKL